MSGEFDPMANVPDHVYLAEFRAAEARQRAAHKNVPFADPHDAERRRLSDEFRRSTMAKQGLSPEEIALRLEKEGIAPPVTDEEAIAAATVPAAMAGPGLFSVLRAQANVGELETPQAEEQFAPDWNSLKDRIKDHSGTWTVERFEFPAHAAMILGFFGKPGWEEPENVLKESFEVIVQNGRVFRADPE